MKSNDYSVCSECGSRVEEYCGQYICSSCGNVYRKVINDYDDQTYEYIKTKNTGKESNPVREKKNRTIPIVLIVCVFVLCSIVCGINAYFNQKAGPNDKESNISLSRTSPSSTSIPKKVELPEALFFMTDLDPLDNGNGTYSLYGYVTDCKGSQYSGCPTTYITTLTGKSYSSGAIEFLRQVYIRNNGTIGVIATDAMYNPYHIRGILFKFTYDSSGNLIEISQQ